MPVFLSSSHSAFNYFSPKKEGETPGRAASTWPGVLVFTLQEGPQDRAPLVPPWQLLASLPTPLGTRVHF